METTSDLLANVPETFIWDLIMEVMQNCPECSSSLECVSWHYATCTYTFFDECESKQYQIGYQDLRKGFTKLIELTHEKKFRASGWDIDPIIAPTQEAFDEWASRWDATVVDALIQCTLFDDIIYN